MINRPAGDENPCPTGNSDYPATLGMTNRETGAARI